MRREDCLLKYFKTKLNTNKKTEALLKAFAGTYRKIWNTSMLKQWDILAFSKGVNPYLTGTELMNVLKGMIKKSFPYLKKMDGGLLTSAAFRSNESFRRWFDTYTFESERNPKFLSRKKDNMSFKTSGNVRVFYDYIEVPKLGKIKLFEKGYIPQGKTYSNITFSHDGVNWWLSLEIREDKDAYKVEDLKDEATLSFDKEGDIYLNNTLLSTAVTSETYKKVERRKRSLEKKLKRQSLSNMVKVKGGKKTRTSKNMVKTRQLIAKIKARLEALRKDSFKKNVNEVAKTKLQQLYLPSSTTISQKLQGGLSRVMREKHTLEFLNMIRKKVELMGTEVVYHASPIKFSAPQVLG